MTQANNLRKDILRHYLQIVAIFLVSAAILLISSGDLNWLWAWIYLLIYPVYTLINGLVLPRELLAERGRAKKNLKSWDTTLTKIGILPGIAIPLIAGLDRRWGWSPDYGTMLHLAGVLFYLLGNVIVTWSMYANHYFSTFVRIQSDREHTVATGGPYRIVRHPGYVGILLNTLFTPLILGSFWALVPAAVLAILYILRTHFEDQTLQRELQGYADYTTQVRYRLIPLLW